MRKRLLILSTLVLLAAGASAQQDTLKYRISLRDKAATAYSLERPEQFLSQKAIERRRKQNLAIDSTDLPVCRKYVDEIRRQGVNVIVTGKLGEFCHSFLQRLCLDRPYCGIAVCTHCGESVDRPENKGRDDVCNTRFGSQYPQNIY